MRELVEREEGARLDGWGSGMREREKGGDWMDAGMG